MPGTGERSRRDRRGRRTHAFPAGKSFHCSDLEPEQAGRWADIFRFDCYLNTNEPVPLTLRCTSVPSVHALLMPNMRPPRLNTDLEPNLQPFDSIRRVSQ